MAIFDCFTFFKEFDVLEMRFKILAPYVDYFVLVESSKTHHGEDKPFYYYKNRERYQEWWNKIIYVQIKDAPEYRGEGDMGIENFLRNSIMRGLVEKARPEDYIIVSDVDEIINPGLLKEIGKQKVSLYANRGSWKHKLRQHMKVWSMFSNDFIKKKREGLSLEKLIDYTPIGLEYNLFYYFMNCQSKSVWRGPYITKYAHMMMPQEPRELAYQNQLPLLRNAGWHFSYLGGVESIKNKLAALSDPDPMLEKRMKEAGNSDAFIQKCLDEGKDILGRKGKMFEYYFISPKDIGVPNIEEIEETYPQFIRNK